MTEPERDEFDRITDQPELRDLHPTQASPLPSAIILGLMIAAVLAGVLLSSWRLAVAGVLVGLIALVLTGGITAHRARRR